MDLDESLNDEYYQLQIGDIIFANRYTTEEEMLEIPDGHRIGPYVVIGKENNEFLCLYISGATPKFNSHYNTTLILDDINYDLNKISYIYLTKYTYISKDRFIKKFEYLNEIDTKMLFKKIDIIIKMGILNDININIPNIPLEIGDIINNNGQLYLIVNETNDIYQCIKMNKNIYEYDFLIKLDTIGYNFNFDNLINFNKDLNLTRYNFLDNKKLHVVLTKYREKLNLLKQNSEIHRGSLIKINNYYYYVYGETGNSWMAFSLQKNSNENLCKLIINRKKYYTNFNNTIIFPKTKKDIEIICFANEYEIDNIKNCKKSYIKELQSNNKKNNINKDNKLIKSEIQPGTIVKFAKSDTGYLHLVIARNNYELITIRYDKYLNNEYLYATFNVEQMESCGHIYNFDLMQLLIDIRNNVISNGDIRRIKKVINEMNQIDDNLSENKDKFKIIRKLIPQK